MPTPHGWGHGGCTKLSTPPAARAAFIGPDSRCFLSQQAWARFRLGQPQVALSSQNVAWPNTLTHWISETQFKKKKKVK